jgi:hypothetical protein
MPLTAVFLCIWSRALTADIGNNTKVNLVIHELPQEPLRTFVVSISHISVSLADKGHIP